MLLAQVFQTDNEICVFYGCVPTVEALQRYPPSLRTAALHATVCSMPAPAATEQRFLHRCTHWMCRYLCNSEDVLDLLSKSGRCDRFAVGSAQVCLLALELTASVAHAPVEGGRVLLAIAGYRRGTPWGQLAHMLRGIFLRTTTGLRSTVAAIKIVTRTIRDVFTALACSDV